MKYRCESCDVIEDSMREALEDARHFVASSAHRTDRDLLILDEKRGVYVLTPKDTLAKIDAALSTPPRNCDIGTALEQVARHRIWCKGGGDCAVSCKMCFAKWAQMPYEKGSAK